MSKLIDLSGPLYEGMWSYSRLLDLRSPLPEFGCEQLATIAADGFEAFGYRLSSLTGSYIETGRHMLEDAPALHDLPLSAFIRPTVVCHVPRKEPGEVIHGVELAANCPSVQPGDALLIECGWGSRWGEPDYVTGSPAYHLDCLPWFMAQSFAILGVDVPCIESARSRPDGAEAAGNMLVPLFQRGLLLLAPLVNLDQIRTPRGQLIALPLNIRAVSGAPCRAVFTES
jgi:kynurenine formamidase